MSVPPDTLGSRSLPLQCSSCKPQHPDSVPAPHILPLTRPNKNISHQHILSSLPRAPIHASLEKPAKYSYQHAVITANNEYKWDSRLNSSASLNASAKVGGHCCPLQAWSNESHGMGLSAPGHARSWGEGHAFLPGKAPGCAHTAPAAALPCSKTQGLPGRSVLLLLENDIFFFFCEEGSALRSEHTCFHASRPGGTCSHFLREKDFDTI